MHFWRLFGPVDLSSNCFYFFASQVLLQVFVSNIKSNLLKIFLYTGVAGLPDEKEKLKIKSADMWKSNLLKCENPISSNVKIKLAQIWKSNQLKCENEENQNLEVAACQLKFPDLASLLRVLRCRENKNCHSVFCAPGPCEQEQLRLAQIWYLYLLLFEQTFNDLAGLSWSSRE